MCDIGQRNIESSFYRNLRPEAGNVELDYQRIEELIAEISHYSPKPRISVTTTEPFLYKGLFDLSDMISRKGIEFQVTTNGSLLSDHIDDIFSSQMRELAISIDGQGEVHDGIRGMAGLYDKIIFSLQQISDKKKRKNTRFPVITLPVTISNFNYGGLRALVDDLDASLYDRIIVSHMNFIDQGMVDEHNKKFSFVGIAESAGLPGETDHYKVDVKILYEQIRYIKSNYAKVHFSPDYEFTDLEVFYNQPARFMWENRCFIPWSVTEVLSNGDVIPLTRCIHMKMGNIYRQSLGEIWNGQDYRKLRKNLQRYRRFPICRRCRGIL